jgi:hypothetical protein
MGKAFSKQWLHRPLLTETLPYEVPVIFTNDRFHRGVSWKSDDPATQSALAKLFAPVKKYTKPYNYQIRKDATRSTTLSIIHPLWQVELCGIYTDHEGSLLSYCSKSEFSLRRPFSVASVYAEKITSNATPKEGIVQVASDTEEFDPAHVVSYFTYTKFNLLSKFFNSREFLRHEERFSLMRTLDISKCFYNIYTHTVSWAVKDKEFAKEHANAHSFEARFDRAMQMGNYNETHGIIVGPELSRIFAEIILQEADSRVQRDLLGASLRHEVDYVIRRYVDDFYIFANTEEQLDKIERTVAKHLEVFKLYLNTQKIRTYTRPFITPLTLARAELREVTHAVEALAKDDSKPANLRAKGIRLALHEVRGIVSRHSIEIANLSGLLLGWLRRLIEQIQHRLRTEPAVVSADTWLELIRAAVDVSLYVCALDLRVRTTYSLCQIVKSVFEAKALVPEAHFDQIQHIIGERLISFTSALSADSETAEEDMIELFNILICGTHFLGNAFTENSKIRNLLTDLLNGKNVTYFRYIVLKFCFLTDSVTFSKELDSLNAIIQKRLLTGEDPRRSSEQYLLLCDYLSSPDVEEVHKRSVFNHCFGGVISTAAMASVTSLIGFVDWNVVNVEHTLRRKELRPVYAVA